MWTCRMYRARPRTKPFIGSTSASPPRSSPSTSSFIRTLGGTLFMALVSSGPCKGRSLDCLQEGTNASRFYREFRPSPVHDREDAASLYQWYDLGSRTPPRHVWRTR